jgi:hypothetical protein
MDFANLTFLLFTAFSGMRVFSYFPQIQKVARDTNGASAISYSTWTMWTGANTATALYATINLGDVYLACVSTLYAGCCLVVIVVTALKRRDWNFLRASAVPPTPEEATPDHLLRFRVTSCRRCAHHPA